VGLSVSVHTQLGVTTLRLAGAVDLAAVDTLTAALTEVVRAPDVRGIVVDLAAVSYLDSTGVAALVQGRRTAEQRGRAYRVVNASGIIERVLQITGVLGYLGGAGTDPGTG
jgi:anti-sigma B factor antagonist